MFQRSDNEVHLGHRRCHLRDREGCGRLLPRGHPQALRGSRHINQDRSLHQYW